MFVFETSDKIAMFTKHKTGQYSRGQDGYGWRNARVGDCPRAMAAKLKNTANGTSCKNKAEAGEMAKRVGPQHRYVCMSYPPCPPAQEKIYVQTNLFKIKSNGNICYIWLC